MKNKKISIRTITGMAILTAIVIVFQLLGSFIKFGQFSITPILIPIVIGSALYGPLAGAFLGGVFGVTVLASGDAAAFLTVSIFGTIVTVMAKGILAGYLSGLVYKAFSMKNRLLAIILAAITAPIVNTGVFLIGCLIFFIPTLKTWAGDTNVYAYMIVGLVGLNFIFEFLLNVILTPAIDRIIAVVTKMIKR